MTYLYPLPIKVEPRTNEGLRAWQLYVRRNEVSLYRGPFPCRLLRTTEAKNIVRSTKDFVKVLYTKDLSLTIIPHFEKWQQRSQRFSLENRQSPGDEVGKRGLSRALKVGGL